MALHYFAIFKKLILINVLLCRWFSDVNILQGSVVTRLQSGAIFNLLCYKFSVNKRIMIIGQYRI